MQLSNKNELLIYIITWINLKCIFLSLLKSNLKGYILYDYIYVILQERHSYREGKKINDCQGLGVKGGLAINGKTSKFGVCGMVLNGTAAVYTQLCIYQYT